MIEFKVIRRTEAGDQLYEDYLIFPDFETADAWAERENELNPGSILDLEEVRNYHLTKEYDYE